jgi:hypothetical protein
MRTLQECLGHAGIATTEIYADYRPSAHEAEWVEAAFSRGATGGANRGGVSDSQGLSVRTDTPSDTHPE